MNGKFITTYTFPSTVTGSITAEGGTLIAVMYIDSLIVNDCSFWFAGYDQAYKKNIIIGAGGCGNIQPADTELFLRAIEEVTIYGEFGVPLGAELTIETNVTCYDN